MINIHSFPASKDKAQVEATRPDITDVSSLHHAFLIVGHSSLFGSS